MKILLCSEFFFPSVGGVQEVMKQLAVRLTQRGHQVTVATSTLANRESDQYFGITIKSFSISGNLTNGLNGEVEAYRQFVAGSDFDLIFIYAAQQWTFDALWELLPQLAARKVIVPCGYSGLGVPAYEDYFDRLPNILRHFDAAVYHAYDYRDHRFAISHDLRNSHFIPNGADDREFLQPPTPMLRHALGIAQDDFILLTVGTMNGAKGHLEVAEAFAKTDLAQASTLILNGNTMPSSENGLLSGLTKALRLLRKRGLLATCKSLAAKVLASLGLRPDHLAILKKTIHAINTGQYGEHKKVLIVDLPRPDLISAFFAADLFVFASLIEYSPLVLFEACAAGLPFLSVPVGNAAEIAEWTGGGEICPASVDENGYTRVNPGILASNIARLAADPALLEKLGNAGRAAWEVRFNWHAITNEYENLFLQLAAAPKSE